MAARRELTMPLAGHRLLVTRAAAQAASLVNGLRALGGEVVEVPLVRFAPTDPGAARRATEDLGRFDHVVFASANAVEFAWQAAGESLTRWAEAGGREPQALAVGPATAAALRARGVEVGSVPEKFSAEGMAEMLEARGVSGGTFLFLRAAAGREYLPDWVKEHGGDLTSVPVYRTERDPAAGRAIVEALAGGLDLITLASPSAVEAFCAAADAEHAAPLPRVACIGPTTAEAARRLGLTVAVVAPEHSAQGLVEAIGDYFAMHDSRR